MKSPQLLALKSAERFILAELATKEKSYLPNPTEAEQADLTAAMEVKQIVQRSIVDGELQPDCRCELLSTLKRALQALNTAKSFNTGLPTLDGRFFTRGLGSYALCSEIEAVIRRAEG